MGAEQEPPAELSDEQWASGREIAELCGLDATVLDQQMVWNGQVASVGYGLAHSAHHMDELTVDQIRTAVFNGIAAYTTLEGSA